ncbi:ribonucleoside-diphosphate reductase subunit alpha [Peribacillus psychrosaccharolyticus]|uniref:Ribonucleoside-diphosphate reductase n=1 Tax=Peribacillus psychrosaccharolyticus TaxID=1407 RepID=A0A974S240_PERPY|nr:ribonucleoside-diphosphate reductase subunit alpha [Peribacillus psychrosaccharolyticus]MEC2054877.1 ribonucleoside-diphosphate reductase subunit alpha [Peribacillus psychrosaccharolyticus]MED3744680.1 ribonucleoside-diphosphate reductase subunit alpha [Peribacillus psychrosaccharolyticus]QQT02199.1 ribonucleoside-diphosphate reductase subunit alpha [Peribacillus psychrosaccharolyticus]
MIQTKDLTKSNSSEQFTILSKEFEGRLDMKSFETRFQKWLDRQSDSSEAKVSRKLIQMALEKVDIDAPDWTFAAAAELLHSMYRESRANRGEKISYGSFYGLLQQLSTPQLGQRYSVYKPELLASYTKEEIEELESTIDPEKDKLFSYIGLYLLNDRYLARPEKDAVYELPQERFMIIAMEIMRNEPSMRIQLVKEAYWAMSNLYMTVATPTLSNAGKSHGQLSSCFIDAIDDSIDGIYMANYDAARVSKFGGGVGLYAGKIRALGSDIRGFAGNSSGTTPWIRLFNQTAVSVDQLGQRKGAIAIYLDVWHKDILSFLDLKTQNGDDRLKAHDIFTGVCIPDLFMEAVRDRSEWYLFDPHTVKETLGFSLEDHFDEVKGQGSFRKQYAIAVQAAEDGTLPHFSFEKIPAITIMKNIMISQLEEGVPYMFYRDEVNRMNPNKHKGMIYCSNLCTEIAQNLSPTTISQEYTTEDGDVVIVRKSGDFVVCNLSSVNLPRAVGDDVLERLIPIQVRMLDNVIDVNSLPVKQAEISNKRYRAIGLGTFGWHHLLANKNIYWESDEAIQLADSLYEQIAYLTIQASNQLAQEKESYPYFEGSDWHTGEYFSLRTYEDDKWLQLKNDVKQHGLRNGYLMAIAPNSSTAKIGNSTDGIDPLYEIEFYEEKKNFKFKVTAPGLTPNTYEYYKKTRFHLDQKESIKQNAARQRHIDQAISFNLYVHNTIKAKELLDIHLTAWNSGMKSTYYVRSTSSEFSSACESCSS